MNRKNAAIGLALLVAIIAGANLVGVELNGLFLRIPGSDKVVHVIAYTAAFVCFFALAGIVSPSVRTRVALAAAAGLTLSIGDELLQELAPGRNVEFFDLIADWAGLTLGWVISVRPAPRIAAVACAAALVSGAFVAHDTYANLIDYSRAIQAERRFDFAAARGHYLTALANGHRTADVYNGLAWVTVESGGNAAEAAEYAATALQMRPDNPDILDTYGWSLHRAGRSAEALPYLQRALAAKPEMYCIHYHLGETYLALGQDAVADEHLRLQAAMKGTREAPLAAQALARPRAAATSGVSR
ncbi:MAG TPA: VanZ family protein [Vicinamibacterales bacterium]|nr:VanZ family protein [Vicinamibacterales bacterium]